MKRVDLKYGSFACSIQGFEDPATTLEVILRHLQKAVSENPVLAEAGLLDDETAQAIVDEVHGGNEHGAVTMMPGLVILWEGDVQSPAAAPPEAEDAAHAARPSPALDPLAEDAQDDPGLAALRAALDAHEERHRGEDDDMGDGVADGPSIFDEAADEGDADDDGELVLSDDAREAAADSSSVLGDDGLMDDDTERPDLRLEPEDTSAFDDDNEAEAAVPDTEHETRSEDDSSSIFDEPEERAGGGTMFDDPDGTDIGDDIGEPDDFDDDLGPPPDDLDEDPKVRMKGSFADFARQFHVAGGTDVEDVEDDNRNEDFIVAGVSTSDIVKATKASSVPDLIAAAAASLSIVQGRMSFTRKDVLDEFDRIPGEHPKTAEAKIKGWGRLVRDGRIRAAEDDLFSLTMDERDRHRDALNR